MTVLDKLLRPLWEISSEPIVITGNEPDLNDRRIVYVNQAFRRATGYTGDEAMGRPPSFLHGPDTDPNIVRTSEEQLRNGQSQEYTLTHYRKDGSPCRFTITRAPLLDLDGRSEFIIAMWRPVMQSGPRPANEDVLHSDSVPLTLPMPLHEYPAGGHPRHLTWHPELEALKALWVEACGRRALPTREDFGLDIMTRWAPHLSIAVVTTDGRFQFRLFGTQLADVYGRDLTGCFLDELTPNDLWNVVILHYSRGGQDTAAALCADQPEQRAMVYRGQSSVAAAVRQSRSQFHHGGGLPAQPPVARRHGFPTCPVMAARSPRPSAIGRDPRRRPVEGLVCRPAVRGQGGERRRRLAEAREFRRSSAENSGILRRRACRTKQPRKRAKMAGSRR